jgi:hypothetical protein
MNANTTPTATPRPAATGAPVLLSPAEVPTTARRGQAPTPTAPAMPRPRVWPVALLALPAFVAIWSGWVGLGGLTGFGKVNPLPGTPLAAWTLDTAITLPIGMEVYAAYALRVWLTGHLSDPATRFAKWSAIGALLLGAAGQVAYHLMTAAGITRAPWWITTLVACLPVAVLGTGAALAHLIRDNHHHDTTIPVAVPTPTASTPTVSVSDDADAPDHNEDDEDAVAGTVPPPRPAPRFQPSHAAAADASRAPASTTRPARRPASRAAGSATGTGVTVRRLRAQHPDWTTARIAQRAGVTERTVRRHLNPNNGTAAGATDPGGDAAAA